MSCLERICTATNSVSEITSGRGKKLSSKSVSSCPTNSVPQEGSAVPKASGGSQELDSDALKSCGAQLRQCILEQDLKLDNKFCDASE